MRTIDHEVRDSRETIRSWTALCSAMLGAFMAVLDIQITNSSLPDILGSLGATLDEGSWIQTSYLVAEIIVIPLTAWLSGVFGPRRYLLVNTALFLGFSVACAFAWDLGSLIVFRVFQGFTGGVLIPTAFTLVLKLLPPAQRPLGFGLFGMTATFAPAIGPAIGGWLTENHGWPAIFYLNLVPGILMLAGVAWGLDEERPRLAELRKGDWGGVVTMAVGLGSLIVLLEEGNRHEWFSSRSMVLLAVVAAVSLAWAVGIELMVREPFLNLRLLGRRNFAVGAVVSFATGFAMYGTTYLLPVYLAQVQGYNSRQIGMTILWSGAPQLLMMPLAAAMLRRVDARMLLGFGLACFSASCWMNSTLTHLTAHDQLRVAQLVRAVGMPFTIVPLTALATGGIEEQQSGSASALFNMLRNLGGSVGIACLATGLDVREKLHSVRLGEKLDPFHPMLQERLENLTGHFKMFGADAVSAGQQAWGVISETVRRESFVLSHGDAFLLVAAVLALMLLLPPMFKPVRGETAAVH